MVYRQIDKRSKRAGGSVATVIQGPPIQEKIEIKTTKPVDPKVLRARIAADLMRELGK